jgi:hypothetical protein
MRKRTFVVFVSYIWTKILLELTFYPFTSVREVVRRPILLPTIFSPFLGIILIFLISRVAALFVATTGIFRVGISLLLSSAVLSIFMWQILLLYLLLSYVFALWKNQPK